MILLGVLIPVENPRGTLSLFKAQCVLLVYMMKKPEHDFESQNKLAIRVGAS